MHHLKSELSDPIESIINSRDLDAREKDSMISKEREKRHAEFR